VITARGVSSNYFGLIYFQISAKLALRSAVSPSDAKDKRLGDKMPQPIDDPKTACKFLII
jgi:hypothetical protein